MVQKNSRQVRGIVVSLIALVLFFGLYVFFFVVPKVVDQRANKVFGITPNVSEGDLSESGEEVHSDLIVADLHADTLLWDRELTRRGEWGHLDFPRMREGNLAIATMGIVTKSPRGLNLVANRSDSDNITLLAIAERWDFSTFFSLSERVLYQANRLQKFIDEDGKVRLIASQKQLVDFLEERARDLDVIGVLLAVEGSHALEGDLAKLSALKASGITMLSPSHLFDSEIAGSSTGLAKEGLTELGKKWVLEMNLSDLIIDLSHASEKTIDDVLELSSKPILVSHTGFRKVCDHNRNLSEEKLKQIVARGGLIGVGIWAEVVCGKDLQSVAKAFRYAADIVGIDHLALGTDFDGFVGTPIDASQLAYLTNALIQVGFSAQDLKKIMGQNYIQFLEKNLPKI